MTGVSIEPPPVYHRNCLLAYFHYTTIVSRRARAAQSPAVYSSRVP